MLMLPISVTPTVSAFGPETVLATKPRGKGLSVAGKSSGAKDQVDDFRVIYEENFEYVWRVLRRIGVRHTDVRDLTQKVFMTVHLRLPGFEGRSQLRTWLFGICRRVASDYRRSAAARREVVTDVVEIGARPDDHDGPLKVVESRDRAALAEAILDKLPQTQREVFLLFELEGLSGDEIAEMLSLSVGTVRSRIRLARETFRKEVRRLALVPDGPQGGGGR